MKAASGRGRKLQSRVWEGYGKKIFACQFFMQNQGVRKNFKNSPLLTQKNQNFLLF